MKQSQFHMMDKNRLPQGKKIISEKYLVGTLHPKKFYQ
jgi:hypothetical protein